MDKLKTISMVVGDLSSRKPTGTDVKDIERFQKGFGGLNNKMETFL